MAKSATYHGDDLALPKVEEKIGRPLSPYAATKAMNEMYAGVFARTAGLPFIALRYFNVFGPRQDPDGAYAAVIPKWISALLHRQPVFINGDGETSRDFSFVANVVQANLLAATSRDPEVLGQVYNIAVGGKMPLNALFATLRGLVVERHPELVVPAPVYEGFRPGDIRHSQADIGKARGLLGYDPTYDVGSGLREALPWYEARLRRPPAGRREVVQGVDDLI